MLCARSLWLSLSLSRSLVPSCYSPSAAATSSACRVRFVNGSTGNISTLFGDATSNAPTEVAEGSRVLSTSPCGQPKLAFFYRSYRYTKWNNSVFYVSGGRGRQLHRDYVSMVQLVIHCLWVVMHCCH